MIDFLTKELPASDRDFREVERITDAHALFHAYYDTPRPPSRPSTNYGSNPHTPNRTLITYRRQSCAFVYGRYYVIEDDKWAAMPRPFEHFFSLDPRGYALTVNIYVHTTLH